MLFLFVSSPASQISQLPLYLRSHILDYIHLKFNLYLYTPSTWYPQWQIKQTRAMTPLAPPATKSLTRLRRLQSLLLFLPKRSKSIHRLQRSWSS